jgi:hypothetical protein
METDPVSEKLTFCSMPDDGQSPETQQSWPRKVLSTVNLFCAVVKREQWHLKIRREESI